MSNGYFSCPIQVAREIQRERERVRETERLEREREKPSKILPVKTEVKPPITFEVTKKIIFRNK